MVGEGATLIPSAAFIPGYPDGGGQHLMLLGMEQPFLIWGMVTHAMWHTTCPIHLTDGGSR